MFETVPPPRQRLLVFARLPQRGRVKTRLAAHVGPDRALEIYEAMLGDVLEAVGPSTPRMEIEVLWAPVADADGAALRAAFGSRPVAIQTGESLGERLAMAFSERFFFHRTRKIVAIGVDDPSISRPLIDHAFALLESCEWVVGPAVDGGYYLIGCRADAFDSSIFSGIEWGTGAVFTATMERIARTEQSVAVLPMRYDIDTLADLERYAREEHGGRLAELLRVL